MVNGLETMANIMGEKFSTEFSSVSQTMWEKKLVECVFGLMIMKEKEHYQNGFVDGFVEKV